jgi:2-polyprenyl-3-methyl-5-hydroxy-6-metoxy-1,4-benzoquinol methylase
LDIKSYYHAHETAYKEIKSKGFVGWGDAKNLEELGDEKTIQYLKETITQFFPKTNGEKALDVGCGTGTTAFTLARYGFDTTGIDISETAIQMGNDLAAQQNLKISFVVGDILELDQFVGKFDFIYDSHCLHCIVFEKDRRKVLLNLKNALNNDGIFVLDTMIQPENGKVDFTGSHSALRFDENYILWHKTKPSNDHGIAEIDGQHWCAQRRIYPAETVLEEVRQAGFTIVAERMDAQHDKPSMLRLVLK